MAYTEVKIVEVLPDDSGAGITKTARGYSFGVRYRLENGEFEPSTETCRLLREAKAEVASLPKRPKYPMIARYDDNGRRVAIVARISFSIGADV